MKRTARFCVSAGCMLLLIALFFGWRSLMVFIAMPQSCVFSFDPRVSKQFQQQVTEFAQSLDPRLMADPESYSEHLKKQFPLINSVQTELSETGTLFVSIESAHPVCCINEEFVVTNPGVKGLIESYEGSALSHLPRIDCAPENLQSWSACDLCSLALALGTALNEKYSLELRKYPELILVDKQQPKISIQTRADLFNAAEIVQRGDVLKALLVDRGAFTGKKQRHWVADMRFVKQIVLKVN